MYYDCNEHIFFSCQWSKNERSALCKGEEEVSSSVSNAGSFHQWEQKKKKKRPQRHKLSVFCQDGKRKLSFFTVQWQRPKTHSWLKSKRLEKRKKELQERISHPDAHVSIRTHTKVEAWKLKHRTRTHTHTRIHAHSRHIMHLSSQREIYPQTAGIRHFNGTQWGFHGYSMYRNNKRGPSPRAWLATGTNLHLKQGG